jgi:hypothetical protein
MDCRFLLMAPTLDAGSRLANGLNMDSRRKQTEAKSEDSRYYL